MLQTLTSPYQNKTKQNQNKIKVKNKTERTPQHQVL